MERLRELSITARGLWYRYYEESASVHPRRISPASYRAGVEVGWLSGLSVGFVFGMMFLAAVLGQGMLK